MGCASSHENDAVTPASPKDTRTATHTDGDDFSPVPQPAVFAPLSFDEDVESAATPARCNPLAEPPADTFNVTADASASATPEPAHTRRPNTTSDRATFNRHTSSLNYAAGLSQVPSATALDRSCLSPETPTMATPSKSASWMLTPTSPRRLTIRTRSGQAKTVSGPLAAHIAADVHHVRDGDRVRLEAAPRDAAACLRDPAVALRVTLHNMPTWSMAEDAFVGE